MDQQQWNQASEQERFEAVIADLVPDADTDDQDAWDTLYQGGGVATADHLIPCSWCP